MEKKSKIDQTDRTKTITYLSLTPNVKIKLFY